MANGRRSYYKRGKTRLNDSMFSSMMEVIEDRAKELEKEGDETKLKDFLDKVFNAKKLDEVADNMADDIIKRSRGDVRKAVKFERKQKQGFEKRLYKTWDTTIKSYVELLGVSLEAIENHRKITHDNLGEKDTFLPFLLRLHARAHRTANEILALMQAGYGAGALARWRSMHETVVILAYAREQGPKIMRYMEDHEAVLSYKTMLNYQLYCEKLGQKPYSAYEMSLAKQKYKRRLKKYKISTKNEKKQFEASYGWAWAISNHKINSFRDLEKNVDRDYLNPYYKLASINVHMEWRSLFVGEEFEALSDPTDSVILVGPADYGFEDAVSLALLTTMQATILILTYNISYESMVYAKVMMAIERRAQHDLEKDIDALKKRAASGKPAED